jgi:hypothetical protein
MNKRVRGIAAWLIILSAPAVAEPPPVDTTTVARIADAGFNHSELAATAEYLTDRIGGRMTNSPAMREAERWTQERFRAWGLKNVRAEGFEFGRGWWIESSQVRLVAPRPLVLRAIPVAWTPPTNGALTAPVVVAPLRTVQDFADWHGKLAGKIVLYSWPEPPKDLTEPPFKRLTDADVGKHNAYAQPSFDPEEKRREVEKWSFGKKVDAFLAAEGAHSLGRACRAAMASCCTARVTSISPASRRSCPASRSPRRTTARSRASPRPGRCDWRSTAACTTRTPTTTPTTSTRKSRALIPRPAT